MAMSRVRPSALRCVASVREMTEEFLSWAEEYFSDESHRNTRLQRRELYDAFLAYAPEQRKFCTVTTFKKRIIKYCEYKEYRFNPQKYDPVTGLPCNLDKDGQPVIDDKSAGIEYFTVGDDTFYSAHSGDIASEISTLLPDDDTDSPF